MFARLGDALTEMVSTQLALLDSIAFRIFVICQGVPEMGKVCAGSGICEHERERYQCKACRGAASASTGGSDLDARNAEEGVSAITGEYDRNAGTAGEAASASTGSSDLHVMLVLRLIFMQPTEGDLTFGQACGTVEKRAIVDQCQVST
eukprot:763882-Hanusia_phi.AAC.1